MVEFFAQKGHHRTESRCDVDGVLVCIGPVEHQFAAIGGITASI